MPRPGTRRAFIVTTTIAVLRVPGPDVDDEDDPRDGADALPDPVPIATGIAAHIGIGRATEDRGETSRQVGVTRLICDPTDLVHTDLILDETTGITWALTSTSLDERLGLDYLAADLQRVSGVG